jgi:hypothetical protein
MGKSPSLFYCEIPNEFISMGKIPSLFYCETPNEFISMRQSPSREINSHFADQKRVVRNKLISESKGM